MYSKMKAYLKTHGAPLVGALWGWNRMRAYNLTSPPAPSNTSFSFAFFQPVNFHLHFLMNFMGERFLPLLCI